MKTIYTAVIARLKSEVKALRWIDLDTGQLESTPMLNPELDRQSLAFPCALVGIAIAGATDVTSYCQDCDARVTVRLAFNTEMRTSAAAPASVAQTSLKPYDIISEVYSALQGWGTAEFDPLSRASQQKENSRGGLFIYRIDFKTAFEDVTAE